MYDFTWAGYFKFVSWVWGVWVAVFLFGLTYALIFDPAPFTENDRDNIFRFVVLSWPIIACFGLLPYGVLAPFAVSYLEAYREERQRGRPVWCCALAGLFGMLGLVLVLIPVGVFVAAFGYIWVAFEHGMKQHWLTAAALTAISVLLGIAFWTDVIITRININKLRMFKPSNERRIMRK